MSVKIKDIRAGMENIQITAKVVYVGEKRAVETRYGPADMAVTTVEDETGRMNLKLWREQIAKVRTGSIVRIDKAFASLFDGRLELNVGSKGRIETL